MVLKQSRSPYKREALIIQQFNPILNMNYKTSLKAFEFTEIKTVR